MRLIALFFVVSLTTSCLIAQVAEAKISAMSGAYDGRGKPPEKFNVLPSKPKKQPRRDMTATQEK